MSLVLTWEDPATSCVGGGGSLSEQWPHPALGALGRPHNVLLRQGAGGWVVKAGGAVLRHPSSGSSLVTALSLTCVPAGKALPPSSPLNWATQAAASPSLVGGGEQGQEHITDSPLLPVLGRFLTPISWIRKPRLVSSAHTSTDQVPLGPGDTAVTKLRLLTGPEFWWGDWNCPLGAAQRGKGACPESNSVGRIKAQLLALRL